MFSLGCISNYLCDVGFLRQIIWSGHAQQFLPIIRMYQHWTRLINKVFVIIIAPTMPEYYKSHPILSGFSSSFCIYFGLRFSSLFHKLYLAVTVAWSYFESCSAFYLSEICIRFLVFSDCLYLTQCSILYSKLFDSVPGTSGALTSRRVGADGMNALRAVYR